MYPSHKSLECGNTESRRYGLRMPPHMVDQRHVFDMCVYRIPFNCIGLTGTVFMELSSQHVCNSYAHQPYSRGEPNFQVFKYCCSRPTWHLKFEPECYKVHTYHTVSSDSCFYEGSVSLCLPGLFTKPLSHITHYTQVWIIW